MGRGGDDALRGRDGDDDLRGGDGMDVLRGDKGDDRLTGGNGADEFRFNSGHDVIVDFEAGLDSVLIKSGLTLGADLTEADLRAAASVVNGDLVLEFGSNHSLTFVGYAALDDVLGSIAGY